MHYTVYSARTAVGALKVRIICGKEEKRCVIN